MKEKFLNSFNLMIHKQINNEKKKTDYSFLYDLDEKIVSDEEKNHLSIKEQLSLVKKPTSSYKIRIPYYIKNALKRLYLFEYRNFNDDGTIKNEKGLIRGSNKIEANKNAKIVYELKYPPVKILPIEFDKDRLLEKIIANPVESFSSKKISKEQLGIFLVEYASLMEDGIDKEDVINNLLDAITDKTLKDFANELLNSSYKMSQLMKQIGGFDEYTITIIESAESSGSAIEFYKGIKQLGENYIKEAEDKAKFISSLIYPSVLFSIILIGAYSFVKFVVPKLYGLFSELVGKNGLPQYLTSMLHIGEDLNFIILKFLLILAAIYGGIRILMTNPWIMIQLNLLKLKIPLFGLIVKILEENRVLRIMIQTSDSTLSHLDKIQSFEKSTSNELYKRVFRYMYKDYPKKQSLTNTFLDVNEKMGGKIFSKRFISLLKVSKGVKSKIIEKYSKFLAKNLTLLENKMKSVQSLTITGIIIMIAGMIGALFSMIITLVLNVMSKMN